MSRIVPVPNQPQSVAAHTGALRSIGVTDDEAFLLFQRRLGHRQENVGVRPRLVVRVHVLEPDLPVRLPRGIRGNRDDLEPDLLQLRYDRSQLAQLRVAVRSPPSPETDEDRRPQGDRGVEVERRSLRSRIRQDRNGRTDEQWTNLLRRRRRLDLRHGTNPP